MTTRFSIVAGIDTDKCRRIYRDKYVRNHYWTVDAQGNKSARPMTPSEVAVVTAYCHLNNIIDKYKDGIAHGT